MSNHHIDKEMFRLAVTIFIPILLLPLCANCFSAKIHKSDMFGTLVINCKVTFNDWDTMEDPLYVILSARGDVSGIVAWAKWDLHQGGLFGLTNKPTAENISSSINIPACYLHKLGLCDDSSFCIELRSTQQKRFSSQFSCIVRAGSITSNDTVLVGMVGPESMRCSFNKTLIDIIYLILYCCNPIMCHIIMLSVVFFSIFV